MTNPEIKVGQKYRVKNDLEFGYCGVSNGDVLEVLSVEMIEDDDLYYGITEDEMIITPSEITQGIVELVEDSDENSQDAPVFAKGQVWEVVKEIDEDVYVGQRMYIHNIDLHIGGEEAVAYLDLAGTRALRLYEADVHNGRIEKVSDSIYDYFTAQPTEPSEDVSPAWASSVPVGVETHTQAITGSPTAIQSGLSAELLWKFIEGASVYNGHKQFEIRELPWDVLKESVRVLGEYLEEDEDTLASSLEIRLMYNGDSGKFAGTWCASVYQLDHWEADEHPIGHRDRLLFGVEIVRGI